MTQNHRVFTKEATDKPRKIPALPLCAQGKKTGFFSSQQKELVSGASLGEDVRRLAQMRSDISQYEDKRIRRIRSVDGCMYGCVQTILAMKMNG